MKNLEELKIKTRISVTSLFTRLLLLLLLVTTLFLLARAVYVYLPGGMDWIFYFRPAALELLHGRSPYTVHGFYYPFWILLPLMPIALLPAGIGVAALYVLGLLAYAYVAYKLGAQPVTLVFLLLSFPVMSGLYNGQIEWLAVLGLVLPKSLGLFLLLSKPQTGLGIALFWFVEILREAGWSEALRKFVPVGLGFALSFLLFGLWPLQALGRISAGMNASLWPHSIPFGLILLIVAFNKRKLGLSMMASPLLSPYFTFHTWSVVLLGLLPSQVLVVLAAVGTWILGLLS
jgi:hypothetical protein